MTSHPTLRRALACLFALCCNTAVLAQNIPVPHYDEEAKPVDPDVPLPAPPKKENLLRFPTDWPGNEVYIDTASVVLGDNQVASFTLVVHGAGGADNVTFESIRCASSDRRVLAYGRRDGSWSPARSEQWLPIRDSEINRYYYELWSDVFCQGSALRSKRDVLSNIKRGGQAPDFSSPSD